MQPKVRGIRAGEMITELQKLSPDTLIVFDETDFEDPWTHRRWTVNLVGSVINLVQIFDSWVDEDDWDLPPSPPR